MQNLFRVLYEGVMLLLVMLTIMSLWKENSYNLVINWIVWAIFTVDFVIRLVFSKNKWKFIKEHPFLVIAIIPLDQFFQVARIVRIIYLFRIKTIAKYYVSPFVERLTYKSLTLIVLIILGYVLLESIIIWNMESTIDTMLQGIFVSFGYLLFFGREIFVINHPLSIWMLIFTSIIGIILQGLAIQWAFSKGEHYYKKLKKNFNEKRKSS